jgi:hypothetical protein
MPSDFSPLPTIAEESYFSDDLTALMKALNARIQTLLQGRAKLEAERAEILASDPVAIDAKTLEKRSRSRFTEYDLLREEVLVRRELQTFDDARRKECRTAAGQAYTAHTVAQSEIRAALVCLGYVEAEPEALVIGKITPGMVNSHPAVVEARNKYESLSAHADATAFRQGNAEALHRTEQRLAQVRQALTTV